jgi:hypothetical protein
MRERCANEGGVMSRGVRVCRRPEAIRDERALKGQQFDAKHSHSYSTSRLLLRKSATSVLA